MFDDTESICTQRVCTNEKDSDDVATELSSVAPLNLANEVIATYFFEDCMGLPSSIVAPRATKMFTEGDGAPRTSGDDAILKKPTRWLIKVAREVVAELFKHHRQRVQESWGVAID